MEPGTRIAARYEILSSDGEGPTAETYRVFDHEVEVEVALWLIRAELLPDDGDRRVFCADALRARAATHANLRRIFDAGVHAGRAYLTLQPLDGAGLDAVLASGRGRFKAAELLRVATALAEGLAAGHAANLVHGRLSPGEILLVDGVPKIGGMGLWRALDPSAAVGAFAPAAPYHAPEVLRGEAPTPRSDVFSLGAVLVALSRGAPIDDARANLRELPASVAAPLARALADDPDERPPSPTDLLAALGADPEEEAPTRHYLALADAPPADPEFPTDELAPPPLPARAPSAPAVDDLAVPTLRDAPLAVPLPPPTPTPYPPAGQLPPIAPSAPVPVPVPVPGRPSSRAPIRPLWIALCAAALLASAGVTWGIVALVRDPGRSAKPPAGPSVTPVVAARAPDAAVAVLPRAASLEPCPRGMRYVSDPPAFCIDTYEAPGEGFRPVTSLTLDQARAACAARDRRLCTADEWERACRGAGGASYPYGSTFVSGRCHVRAGAGAVLAPAGAHPECVSAAGVYDASGNAAEWVDDGTSRGASYADGGDGRCSRIQRHRPGHASADLGYRCCATPGAF